MAQAISLELGAPIDFSLEEQVDSGDWHTRGFLEAADVLDWEHGLNGGNGARILKDPVGVVGMITPWSWPMNQVARTTKVATAHDPDSHIGPLASAMQFEKVQNLIQTGIDEGARLGEGGVG